MVETLEVEEQTQTAKVREVLKGLQRWQKIGRDSLTFDCIGTARVRKPYRDSMRLRVMCGDF